MCILRQIHLNICCCMLCVVVWGRIYYKNNNFLLKPSLSMLNYGWIKNCLRIRHLKINHSLPNVPSFYCYKPSPSFKIIHENNVPNETLKGFNHVYLYMCFNCIRLCVPFIFQVIKTFWCSFVAVFLLFYELHSSEELSPMLCSHCSI